MKEELGLYSVKNYFYLKDCENKLCADCKSILPGYLSINNGVLICKNCAKIHKENFPDNISYIKSLEEELDDFLLSFIERGGNTRFLNVINTYHLTEMDVNRRYKMKILENYRKTLMSEILCEEPPNKISFQEALEEMSDYDISQSPSIFTNYKVCSYHGNNSSTTSNNSFQQLIYNKIVELCNDPEVQKKVYDGSVKVLNFAKNAAFFAGKTLVEMYMPSLVNQEENQLNESEKEKVQNKPSKPTSKPTSRPITRPTAENHDDFQANNVNNCIDKSQCFVVDTKKKLCKNTEDPQHTLSEQSLPSFSKIMKANEDITDSGITDNSAPPTNSYTEKQP